MNRSAAWLRAHVAQLVTALFVIQPLLDIFSFWLQERGMSNYLSLALRLLVLGVCVLAAFLLSDRKRVYWIAAAVVVLLGVGHFIAARQAGPYRPMTDLTNYIRVILMPVTTICLITFLRQDERAFRGMQLGLTISLFTMFAVEILATALGTGHHTYTDGSGIIGWFSNTNSQSSNLCVLIAISLAWQLSREKRNIPLLLLTGVLGFAALYFFCTRLAYLGIFVIAAGLALTVILIQRKDWPVAVVCILVCVLALGLIKVSPMMKHMHADSSWQDQRQDWINTDIGDAADLQEVLELADKENQQKPTKPITEPTGELDPSTEPDETESDVPVITPDEHQLLVDKLTPIYTHYVPDFVEIFGAEKTMAMFRYSVDVHDFAAVRAKKIMFAQMLLQDSPFTSQLFGLDLNRFTVNGNIYDVENDFHGIYFLQGAVGLAMLALFILYFVALILWALLKNAKRYFTMEAAGYGIAFLLCMAHCYNTAGVLRRPNASVYLSAILAAIYYLVRVRKYPENAPKKRKAKSN